MPNRAILTRPNRSRAHLTAGFMVASTLLSCGGDTDTVASTSWSVSTLAGTGQYGSADGPATTASFANPLNVAADSSGTVFVADSFNHKVRKVSNGVVTTIAGTGAIGLADGPGTAASFDSPIGIAVDTRGTIYVADSGNFKVRVISPSGLVTSLAGSGRQGFADGIGASASFSNLAGIALDASGNVYLADVGNNVIRRVTQTGVVTTVAGTGAIGSLNGPASNATFFEPFGIAVDSDGVLYIADLGNRLIRKISAGMVSTIAGSGSQSVVDGSGITASFAAPIAIAIDSRGNAYVVDFGRIRKITPMGDVSTIAGSVPFGSSDGVGIAASFNGPTSLSLVTDNQLAVGDGANSKIRLVSAK